MESQSMLSPVQTLFFPAGLGICILLKPETAGIYTFYAMAVGDTFDDGDNYKINSFQFEVTEDHIKAFADENTPPTISLITPGLTLIR